MKENRPISLNFKALCEGAFLAPRSDFAVVVFEGPDSKDFLHRLLTSDIKKLGEGATQTSLLLDSKGKILVKMDLLSRGARIFAIVEGRFAPRLIETLERFRFAEQLLIEDQSAAYRCFGLRGARSAAAFESISKRRLASFSIERTQEHGWDLFLSEGEAVSFLESLRERPELKETPLVEEGLLDRVRILCGVARYGKEVDESFYPQEARWENFCAQDKGCYIGQETVARMNTYGKPPRLLSGLEILSAPSAEPGTPLRLGTEIVGSVRSVAKDDASGCGFGIGWIKSAVALPGKRLDMPESGHAIVAQFPGIP